MRRFALSPSIRGRLVIGVALVHAVLMTFFVTDLVHRQRVFLHGEAEARALGLSQMVATTSVSWVLANDVKGLSEVMGSVAAYPDVAWAMVVDDRGQVLGHTDETLLQRWVVDARYRAVLAGRSLE